MPKKSQDDILTYFVYSVTKLEQAKLSCMRGFKMMYWGHFSVCMRKLAKESFNEEEICG